jgi:hypothetical protein
MLPVPRTHDPLAAGWVTGLFLLCLLVLAVVNRTAPRTWRILFQAAFSMRLSKQTMREDVDLQDRNFLGLLLVSVIAIGMFVWQVAARGAGVGPAPYPLFVGSVLAVLLVQGLLPRMVSVLIKADAGANEFLYTGSLLYAWLGLLLLPVTMLAAYHPEWHVWLVRTGAVFVLLTLLYRWVRGAWIGFGEGGFPGYIILYLCAAEIVPALLLVQALR